MEFWARYKKIIFAAGFAIIILLIGYALYFFLFRPSLTPAINTDEPPVAGQSGGLPIAGDGGRQVLPPSENPTSATLPQSPIAQGGLTQTPPLNETRVLEPTLSDSGLSLRYYDIDNNQFYEIDERGDTVALSDKIFYQIEKIAWSPNKNKVILEYPDGANILYDFNTDQQATLPNHWTDFYFSPDGQKIVTKSLGLDPYNRGS